MLQVLSIDDSKAVHAFITSLFNSIPSKVCHAYDGEDGLKKIEEISPNKLDLILLDWEMPKLTGIETLEKIRALGITIPIIMLTSKNSPDEIMKAINLGANEYVMKPFTQDILFEKIESVLGRSIK